MLLSLPRILVLCWLLAAPALRADELLLPIEVDASGRALVTLPADGMRLLYFNALASGFGATSPLLDRGQLGDEALLRFERRGSRMLVVRENPVFMAAGGAASSRAAAESFPEAVLAALEIVEEGRGTLRVDISELLLADVMQLARALEQAGRGKFSVERARSFVDASNTASFPRNTEVRTVLSFSVSNPDTLFLQHAADGRAISFAVQHSFFALPDDGYRPREFHPRSGFFPHVAFDFAQGLDGDYRRRQLVRWRLVPKDKDAYLRGELVEPEQPIVYYLDPAIPEPYRSAFREGGLWYRTLFEAAGFRNAFDIRDLPVEVNPADARYNVIMWVHRSSRGPSVGPAHRDVRSGEILRSIVRMDSYRSLVNHDIWMGLRPAAGTRSLALDSEAMAMARQRQHAAHEIGHTLGLAHNFIAASQDRASVMDYPVPLVTLDADGHIDLSAAYAEGPGAFDRFAIRYGYTWFPDAESERRGLAAILAEADAEGLKFITGDDAGPAGSIPEATIWVEGATMLEALERTLQVRQRLLSAFDETALAPGEPYWFLNKRLAYVYLHHRSALQGAIKAIGGVNYQYALYGEDVAPMSPIPAEEQRAALMLVLSALTPQQLQVPDSALALIPPAPFGWEGGWQGIGDAAPIGSDAGPILTERYLAHALASEITDALLLPERVNRLRAFSPDELMGAMLDHSWRSPPPGDNPALQQLIQRAVLDSLLDLAGSARSAVSVRAAAEWQLAQLQDELERRRPRARSQAEAAEAAHRAAAARDIQRYFVGEDRPESRVRPQPVPLPWP
jgi:hypothetical protein